MYIKIYYLIRGRFIFGRMMDGIRLPSGKIEFGGGEKWKCEV